MRPLPPLTLLILISLTGCELGFTADGQGTPGDRGRTEWQLVDGLCVGLGNACTLDVPVADGATAFVVVDTDLVSYELEEHTVVARGAEVADLSRNTFDDTFAFDLRTSGPGGVDLEVVDLDGEVYDSAALTVATPTAMECGYIPPDSGSVGYAMDNLVVTDEATVAVFESTRPASIELGCRLIDADGRPLLSVDAIRWEVVLADPYADLDGARGARVHAQFEVEDSSITVRASFGDLSQQMRFTAIVGT